MSVLGSRSLAIADRTAALMLALQEALWPFVAVVQIQHRRLLRHQLPGEAVSKAACDRRRDVCTGQQIIGISRHNCSAHVVVARGPCPWVAGSALDGRCCSATHTSGWHHLKYGECLQRANLQSQTEKALVTFDKTSITIRQTVKMY